LALRGHQILRYRRRLQAAGTEALRDRLRTHIKLVAKSFRGCTGDLGGGSVAPPREADEVSVPAPAVAAIATRATRPAAAVSRALTWRIVQAP
jgi:hypothetical protein